jgi:hypothetical protein
LETLVKVELKDGTVCQVAHEALDLLLVHNEIAKFKRTHGWAVIGQDQLRNMDKETAYSIPERRNYLKNCL